MSGVSAVETAGTRRPHIVVIGGGLAGLSAAVACADAGTRVTLLEARPRLGGLTWSFERNSLTFDNGQHVFLRCCTDYRRFLARIGSEGQAPLQDRLALPVIRPGGVTGWLRKDQLPAPLHIARSLLSYPHLGIADRLRVGPAALALRRLDLGDKALDEHSFGEWLARHGQSAAAVEALWDLITLPTVNLRAADASLALGAKVFQTGLLTDAGAADIGWSHVPLQALHGDAAAATLARLGASVQVKARVTEIGAEPGGPVTNVAAGGDVHAADAVILAVPHDVAAGLLPGGAITQQGGLRRLGASPIVNVHVVYDRRVTDLEVAAGIGTPVQFVFDRTQASGLAALDTAAGGRRRQCLAISLSAADAYVGEKPEAMISLVTEALPDLFRAARRASVLDAVVTRERYATFRGEPGTARLRPGPLTHVENLFLAGAWTDTGWPATMEGAVRSGNAAAAAAVACVGGTTVLRDQRSLSLQPHPTDGWAAGGRGRNEFTIAAGEQQDEHAQHDRPEEVVA